MSEKNPPAPSRPKAPSAFRRQYIVNREVQTIFLGFIVAITVFNAGAMILAFYASGLSFDKVLSEFDPALRGVLEEVLTRQHNHLMIYCLISTIVASIVLFVGGLLISHRLVGPMIRLKRAMDEVTAGGNPKEISFRKKDYFKELAVSYNDMVKQLNKPK